MNEVELVADVPCHTGEGPIWHADQQCLYWLDIPLGRLYRFDPASGTHELVFEGRTIGGAVLNEDGGILLLHDRCAVSLWRDGSTKCILEGIADCENTRFNDAIAAPCGAVLAGTMPTPSRLYRLSPSQGPSVIVSDLGQSNGMDFSPDLQWLYHADTRRRTICRYSYHGSSLGLNEVLVQVPEGEGAPDGLTVDQHGCIWVALWDGGCVVRYDPDGNELNRVRVSTPKVSSVAFGGSDLSDLYITTAGGDDREVNGSAAGSLFRVRPGVRGKPAFAARF